MKQIGYVGLLFILILAGCSQAKPTATTVAGQPGPANGAAAGLSGIERLALGTLRLEGTAQAITRAQAAELLPLWTLLQGSSLGNDSERQAVLKQIENKMTAEQQGAINAMSLTIDDLRAWMQEQGIEMSGDGIPPSGQNGQGGPGGFPNMSDDERAKMRQEFENMSDEQRATRMAEMGIQRPDGQGSRPDGSATRPAPGVGGRSMGGGFSSVLLQPLMALLTQRAAE